MGNPILFVIHVIVLLVVITIILITLSLNTKSEGLGAAITGASDSYRGAVGVEEHKRKLLERLCYGFVVLALISIIMTNFL
jgi:preprotein translocase subunit SecG